VSGWGSGSWGLSPWGSGVDPPRLLSAFAIRENCVRLTFDAPIFYNRTLSPRDGSRRQLYGIVPVASTASYDGETARPVIVGRVDAAGGGGALLDLWLDRPLTGYPARYLASAAGVYGASGLPIDASAASATFDGVRAGKPRRSATDGSLVIGADIALPQTEAAALLARASGALLGSYAVDATGDFAFDAGIQSLIKRILRRLFAQPGAFAHLGPTYGMGLGSQVKQLATPTRRGAIAKEAGRQAGLEPEVAEAAATIRQIGRDAWELRLQCRTRFGQSFGFGVPLPAG